MSEHFFKITKIGCDSEKNVEPKSISSDKFSLCHINFNSSLENSLMKKFLLGAYISTHNFNSFCLSEAFLDSAIPRHI